MPERASIQGQSVYFLICLPTLISSLHNHVIAFQPIIIMITKIPPIIVSYKIPMSLPSTANKHGANNQRKHSL